MVNRARVRPLNQARPGQGPVIYWMSRDQRVRDNWALLYAQELALSLGQPLGVVFCLAPAFLGATRRQYGFMLKGLQEVAGDLADLNLPFFLLTGEPARELPGFVANYRVGAVVSDFSPLRLVRGWKTAVAEGIGVSLEEVDAHNVVPCWLASPKAEYGAYTLRPKLKRLLAGVSGRLSGACPAPGGVGGRTAGNPLEGSARHPGHGHRRAGSDLARPRGAPGPGGAGSFPGTAAAVLWGAAERPHAGRPVGPLPLPPFRAPGRARVALEVEARRGHDSSREAFLEELIVRRELADNFCFYQPHYDTFAGFPAWAQKTLNQHRQDRREYLYTAAELESGRTHDELWNAAQRQMVQRGKMHGYMRMYWAKKILEWTASPEEAQAVAIYLNDRYELDGRDPNGYAGIAWSIGGVHDRAWFERPVFGKIRYMSYNGCRSKFKVEAYISQNPGRTGALGAPGRCLPGKHQPLFGKGGADAGYYGNAGGYQEPAGIAKAGGAVHPEPRPALL